MKYIVYILTGITYTDKYYVGFTTNLCERLHYHNSRNSGYSKRYAPWKVETSIVFDSELMARSFERYLKSGSGQAFLKKHLLSKR